MAGDGILSIGATVDKTGVDAGLSSIQDGVQTTVQSIAVQVEETCARTKAAWNRIPEEIKAGSAMVSQAQRNMAESAFANVRAMQAQRDAMRVVKDESMPLVARMGLLAAAQAEVKTTAAGMVGAQRELAAQEAATAEAASLSSNVWVAAFQRAAMGVRESCTSIQEKLVETAETGKLSAEGLTAGFAGLGSLLGAGIFVGFAAHFLDETSKMEIELSHLHEKTGIAIQDLAGLQQIVRESGADWDAIATGLVRMDKALADSNEPSKALVSALGGINLKIDELKGLQPEVQLQKIATAFAGTENAGNRANAAIALFGRGGQALIPILVSQGAALHANIDAASKLTGVTDESVKAAFTWQQTTARLSAEFRRVMVPTIEIVEKAIAGILGVIKGVDAAIWTLIDAIGALGRSLGAVGGVLYDAMTGHFGQMKTDAQELTHDLALIWEDYGTTVAKRWQETASLMTWQPKGAAAPGGNGTVDAGDSGGDGGSGAGSNTGGRGRRSATADAASSGAAPGAPETQSADLSAAGAEMIAQMQAEVIAKQDAIKEEIQADRSAAEEKIRIAAEDYADLQKSTEEKVRLGTMSEAQRVAALRAGSDQENQIRQQQSAFIQMLDMADTKKYEEDLKQQEELTRQYARQVQQLNAEIAQKQQQQYQQMFAAITGPLNTFTDHWLTSGQRMGLAFQKMYDQMAMSAINALLKMTEKWVAHEILVTAAHAAGLTTRKSADAGAEALSNGQLMAELGKWIAMEWAKVTHHVAANTAKTASDVAAASTGAVTAAASSAVQITSQYAVAQSAAGMAAAVAAAEASSGGVLAAIAAGAETYGAISPYVAMSAFERGGIVQGGNGMAVPILAHAGERVLSQSQTQNFESMVNQSSSSKSSEVHFHDHSSWNGVDGDSVEGMYKSHAAAGRRQMMRQLRLANQI